MSVFSYVRLRCSLDDAMARYGRWIGAPELAPPRMVRERNAIDLSLQDEKWLGLSVFFYAFGPWTVIEEISGGLATRSAESWLELADGGDLVYAGMNDAIPYAQIVLVENGRLVRQITKDEQDPSEDVDIGQLPEEAKGQFQDWIDVAQWVEEDELKLERAEEGWLWIHRSDDDDA